MGMKDLKLGAKIGIGFAILIVIIIAVSIFGLYNLSNFNDKVEKADDANRMVKYSLESRREEKNYFLREDSIYVENVNSIIDSLLSQCDETKDKFNQQSNKDLIDELILDVEEYKIAFDSVVEEKDLQSQEEQEMIDNARDVIAECEKLREEQKQLLYEEIEAQKVALELIERIEKADISNRLIKIILECRRSEKNYIMRGDEQYITEVEEYIAELIENAQNGMELMKQQHNIEQVNLIIQSANEYLTAFREYVGSQKRVEEQEELMVESARELQEKADLIRSDQKSEMEQISTNAIIVTIIAAIISLIFGIAVALYITLSITRPISAIVSVSKDVTKGILPAKDIAVKSKDEVGILTTGFNKMVKSLRDILSQVNSSVEQVASGADQVSKSGQSLSQGASEQASSLEEITSSINQISSQSKQNADNATEANSLAQKAMDNAQGGNKQMKELVIAMEKINKSSDSIKKVVKVIDDIAFQINLLALNANVEAARAGKYGKGFAVVAEEVRNLAVKSATSVKETTDMVEASIKDIELGSKSAELTAKQLEDILGGSSKVADLVEEIASASKETAQAIDQINGGLEQIDQVTQSNTANAEESASAAEELSSQAQQLKAMIAHFKLSGNGSELITDRTTETSQENIHKMVQDELKRMGKQEYLSEDVSEEVVTKTGIEDKKGPVVPKEVIKLDDDDFGKF